MSPGIMWINKHDLGPDVDLLNILTATIQYLGRKKTYEHIKLLSWNVPGNSVAAKIDSN